MPATLAAKPQPWSPRIDFYTVYHFPQSSKKFETFLVSSRDSLGLRAVFSFRRGCLPCTDPCTRRAGTAPRSRYSWQHAERTLPGTELTTRPRVPGQPENQPAAEPWVPIPFARALATAASQHLRISPRPESRRRRLHTTATAMTATMHLQHR